MSNDETFILPTGPTELTGHAGYSGTITATDATGSYVYTTNTINLVDVFSDIAPTPVRRTRVRAQKPPYYQMKGGTIPKLKVEKVLRGDCSGHRLEDTVFVMSPYTNFIPLPYILNYPFSSNAATPTNLIAGKLKELDPQGSKKGLSNYLPKANLIEAKRSNILNRIIANLDGREQTYNRVEELIKYETPMPVNHGFFKIRRRMRALDEMGPVFLMSNPDDAYKLKNGRTYSCVVGGLCLFRTPAYHNVVTNIGVMAVVKKEDYLYQKYHFLKYGEVDLTKVVILVDRELDNTDYEVKPFRALYKTHIEPLLKNLDSNIWKVPHEFIVENCFMPSKLLHATGAIKSQEEIETITNAFYDSVAGERKKEATIIVEESEPVPTMEATAFIEEILKAPLVAESVEEEIEPIRVERVLRSPTVDLEPFYNDSEELPI